MAIVCKTCDKGELTPKKVYRMSTPVVIIGYIILIPSIIGALFFAIPLVVTIGMAAFSGAQSGDQSMLGATIASGIMFAGMLVSFVSGVFGWLLTMKKKLLVCSNCAASVAAQ